MEANLSLDPKIIKRICLVCGKMFTKSYGEALRRWLTRKFCSKKCYFVRNGQKVKQKCSTCNKIFLLSPYRVKEKAKYCSCKCFIQRNGKRIEKLCLVCRGKFEVQPHIIKRGDGKFCSKSCAGKYKMSRLSKQRWQNKEYREKTIKSTLRALFKRPTSLEQQLIDLIQTHDLPYKYVGDGSFLIGYKNPDFININGEKKLIEVGNVFHHQGDYIEKRKVHFARYGWESYIFIGDKLDEKEVLNKLQEL